MSRSPRREDRGVLEDYYVAWEFDFYGTFLFEEPQTFVILHISAVSTKVSSWQEQWEDVKPQALMFHSSVTC